MLFEEGGDVAHCLDFVLALCESVALILIHIVANIDATLAKLFHDLIALRLHYPGVIRTLDHEQRGRDLIDVGYR